MHAPILRDMYIEAERVVVRISHLIEDWHPFLLHFNHVVISNCTLCLWLQNIGRNRLVTLSGSTFLRSLGSWHWLCPYSCFGTRAGCSLHTPWIAGPACKIASCDAACHGSHHQSLALLWCYAGGGHPGTHCPCSLWRETKGRGPEARVNHINLEAGPKKVRTGPR